MEVIVDDSQLSLAIGKKGQNVRLAAKLLGWKIDIKSEEEKRQEVESQMAALVAPGRAGFGADRLRLAGKCRREAACRRGSDRRTARQYDAGRIGSDSGHRARNWWSRFATPWSAITASTMRRRKSHRMSESQEQQPTLEMGEEGYNYSESDRRSAPKPRTCG